MIVSRAIALLLALSPSMAGPPVAARSAGSTLDYSIGIFNTGVSPCTNGSYTTAQGGAISITRATAATCESSQGSLSTISANKLVAESAGLRAEASSTNLMPNSEGLSTNWTGTNAVAGGASTASPFADSISPLATTAAGGYFESPSFSITSTSAVLSMFILGSSGSETPNAILRDTTSSVDRCTISTTAPTSWPAMASRPSCSSSAIVSGHTHVVRVYPGGTGGESSTDIYFWGVQVEAGVTTKTSYIPTSGTSATRNADNISITAAGIASAGCFSATILANAPNFPQKIATNPDTIAGYNNTASVFANDGTNTTNSNNVANMTGLSTTVRVLWGGSAIQLGLNGTMGTAGTFDGSMGTGSTLYLGSNGGASQFMGGWLTNIKIGTSNTGCSL